MNHLFEKAYKEIAKAKKIFLVTHFNPDGDAIASICALTLYLESLGKNYFAYCETPLPERYSFIPNFHKVKNAKEINAGSSRFLESFDLILVFDCARKERTSLGRLIGSRSLNLRVIEFDHHPKCDDYAEIELRDSTASSTTEIVYSFFKTNRIPVGRDLATCILTGIITDTDAFLYPSATGQSVKIGSEMLRSGASHLRIVEKYMRNKSLPVLKNWGRILESLVINKKYNIAIAVLTREAFSQRQISEEEYEGLSGFLSNLIGVRAILFLRETEPGVVRGSFRTALKQIDVAKLAEILGGGGHRAAAGFALPGRLVATNSGWKVE